MFIPLDYYRILGVPIQATQEQLRLSYQDRSLQLPRREYSAPAIEARKQLIDEAYAILSDPHKRERYDADFLRNTYEPETNDEEAREADAIAPQPAPSIEIDDSQLVGALLILQELGEYEAVLQLAVSFLPEDALGRDETFDAIAASDLELPKPLEEAPPLDATRSDAILTVALARLELGREQWQQGHYEKAASSLEAGQTLLLREGLFPQIRGEMQADLYKLRPYRILENVAQPERKLAERSRGIQLLRDMLQERGGMDGTQDDRSGMNIDDFLRFVQQLRKHLKASEQQTLFEAEARRPSAVAAYLSVYAAIARGFARRKPALIVRADRTLAQLGRRQDVHLERAICAMLLGQPEQANRFLELSQEEETIAFIRHRSQDAPDLLPGLCLYAERWLQEEVLPHFRDLVGADASLKDYFAEPQVQAYLEALSEEPDPNNEWLVVPAYQPVRTSGEEDVLSSPALVAYEESAARSAASTTISRTALENLRHANGAGTNGNGRNGNHNGRNGTYLQPPAVPLAAPARENPFERVAPPGSKIPASKSIARRKRTRKPNLKLFRLVAAIAAALLALFLLFWVLKKVVNFAVQAMQGSPAALSGDRVRLRLDESLVRLPQPRSTRSLEPARAGKLTPESAASTLQSWYRIKAEALGKEHRIERLQEILVDPALSQWRQIAEYERAAGTYREYQHRSLAVSDIQERREGSDRAIVNVRVREVSRSFSESDNSPISRTDSPLQIRYEFVLQDGKWRLQTWNWRSLD